MRRGEVWTSSGDYCLGGITRGNVIRLCANTGARLHLVQPLGFELDDRRLRRAGLDYHEFADMQVHDGFEQLRRALPTQRMFGFTTKASRHFLTPRSKPTTCCYSGQKLAACLPQCSNRCRQSSGYAYPCAKAAAA